MRYNFWSDKIKDHELSNQPLYYPEEEKKSIKNKFTALSKQHDEKTIIFK